MPTNSKIAIKIIYTLAKAKRPMGLGEIARETKLAKSHVIYHLKQLQHDNIIIRDEDKYYCQPFYSKKETKDDLGDLMRIFINMLAKEMLIDKDATEEELGEQILRNTEIFIRLHKEGLFS